jgi:hypothetical protein
MPSFLRPFNLNKNELQNAVIQVLATAPAAPVGGQVYTSSAGGAGNYTLQFHNGTAFVSLGTGTGSGTVTSVSVVTANGFAGTVATASSTPALTLTTTITGILRGNGTALAAAVGTDFPALNTLTAPTGDLTVAGFKVTNLGTPTAATDAATMGYVDSVATGLDVKASMRAASTANINLAAPGATIDGVTMAAGNRFLAKNQTTGSQNGLYVWNGAAVAATRTTDADSNAEVTSGLYTFVSEGTVNGGTGWVLTTPDPITLGTTALAFTQFNGPGTVVAGTGITVTGNTVAVATTYAGGASIVTVGTITAGTWQGTAVAVGFGGTGAATAAGARTNLGAIGKYTALIGDGTATVFTITQATHGLAADGSLHVATYNVATGNRDYPDESINNTNGTVTITFTNPPAANSYRVVLHG